MSELDNPPVGIRKAGQGLSQEVDILCPVMRGLWGVLGRSRHPDKSLILDRDSLTLAATHLVAKPVHRNPE